MEALKTLGYGEKTRGTNEGQGGCINCGFCTQYISCPASTTGCIACHACVIACPQGVTLPKVMQTQKRNPGRSKNLSFEVNGKKQKAKGIVSVGNVLKKLGRGDDGSAGSRGADLCGTGGCWNCAVMINDNLTRACMTPMENGMSIDNRAEVLSGVTPRRSVTLMRPFPHGHPSVFTHGCNYNCDLCHNWELTFSSTAPALTPQEAAIRLGIQKDKDQWIGISGGEPTLNRPWLIELVQQIRSLAPQSRIQLDTNGSLLTRDYIDDLLEAGITDLSPDFKAIELSTFSNISGIQEPDMAERCMLAAWHTIELLLTRYKDLIYTAVSIPCHPKTHTMDELERMAKALTALDPKIPVTLIELLPAFRNRDLPVVGRQTMEKAAAFLESQGLEKIIIQGGRSIPRAVDPLDLSLSDERF